MFDLLVTLVFLSRVAPSTGGLGSAILEAFTVKPINTYVREKGYPIEEHQIETQDGFKLTYHRIPHGRLGADRGHGHPVLLAHGILQSSALFLAMDDGLAYLLADAGFDVWMTNARGNTYSKTHTHYKNSSGNKEFWDFSFHEMGSHDLPAAIEHILAVTQRPSLSYVGFSMGTAMFWVLSDSSVIPPLTLHSFHEMGSHDLPAAIEHILAVTERPSLSYVGFSMGTAMFWVLADSSVIPPLTLHSFHEMGSHDLPAAIEHILAVTQRPSLSYVGFSMGTAMFWVLSDSSVIPPTTLHSFHGMGSHDLPAAIEHILAVTERPSLSYVGFSMGTAMFWVLADSSVIPPLTLHSFHEMGSHDLPAAIEQILAVTERPSLSYVGFSMGTAMFWVLADSSVIPPLTLHSFHEMGSHDLPAAIEHILAVTQRPSLSYVGFSMGTAMFWVLADSSVIPPTTLHSFHGMGSHDLPAAIEHILAVTERPSLSYVGFSMGTAMFWVLADSSVIPPTTLPSFHGMGSHDLPAAIEHILAVTQRPSLSYVGFSMGTAMFWVLADSSVIPSLTLHSFQEMGSHDLPAAIKHILAVTQRPSLSYVGFSMGTAMFWVLSDSSVIPPLTLHSFQEMGSHDLPAAIEHILAVTQRPSLSYVGFSMGTAMFWVLADSSVIPPTTLHSFHGMGSHDLPAAIEHILAVTERPSLSYVGFSMGTAMFWVLSDSSVIPPLTLHSFQEMGSHDLPAAIEHILAVTQRPSLSYVGFSMGTAMFWVLSDSSVIPSLTLHSFHEMGSHDLPAAIEHILAVTQRPSLSYVGFSMGTAMFWVLSDSSVIPPLTLHSFHEMGSHDLPAAIEHILAVTERPSLSYVGFSMGTAMFWVLSDSSVIPPLTLHSFQEMGSHDLPAAIEHILAVTQRPSLSYVGFSMGTAMFWVLSDSSVIPPLTLHSFHEMGSHDLPAAIEHILAVTQRPSLSYVGFSMGTAMFWVLSDSSVIPPLTLHSFHEMGSHDLPAAIEHILAVTQRPSLSYVGFSMGTAMFWVLSDSSVIPPTTLHSFHGMGSHDLPAAIEHILAVTERPSLSYVGFSMGTAMFWVLADSSVIPPLTLHSFHEMGSHDLPAAIEQILAVTERPSLSYVGFSMGTAMFWVLADSSVIPPLTLHSFHEMGSHDLPAAIEHILAVTQRPSLSYVGFSMGTAMFWVLADSWGPKYMDRVDTMVAIAPMARPSGMSVLRKPNLFKALKAMINIYNLLHWYEVRPFNPVEALLMKVMCSNGSGSLLCANMLSGLVGLYPDSIHYEDTYVSTQYMPAGTSIKNVQHFLQTGVKASFQQFDYGQNDNPKHHEYSSPPKYDLGKVTCPVFFITSDKDKFSAKEDVDWLIEKLPVKPQILFYEAVKGFNHLDYFYSKNVKNILFEPLVQFIKERMKQLQN